MDQLRAMRVFVSVVDEHSFAGAARALDLAPAVVTRLVAELEEHLGARLLNRTTRRVTLTEIGEAYLERARRILIDVEEAAALTNSATTEPRGQVRLLVPAALAVHQIAKYLPRFHKLYPQVTIEMHSPVAVTAPDDGFDLTIVHSRDPLDGEFVAHRLARSETIAVASPEYLDRRGRPQHPSELLSHDSLLPMPAMLHDGITFRRGTPGEGGESFVLHPGRGLLSTANFDTNYAAALHGLGIAGLPSFQVEDALLENALERILPEWRLRTWTIWACMPTRKFVPARTRALLDFLIEVFGGEDRDPWLLAANCETRMPAAPAPQRA